MVRAVLDNSQARGAARLLLIAIADRSDEQGRGAYLTRAQLSQHAHVDERTVKRGLRELEGLGELAIVGRTKRGAHVFEIRLVHVENPVEKPVGNVEGGNMPRGQFVQKGGRNAPPRGGNMPPHQTVQERSGNKDQRAARAIRTLLRSTGSNPRLLNKLAHDVLDDVDAGTLDLLDVHEELKCRAAKARLTYNAEQTGVALARAFRAREHRRVG